MKKFRILLAEDHTLLRAGIRSLIVAEPEFDVVGEVGNGRDALHAVAVLQPNLVLMDISMPGTNGTEAIADIKRRHPETRILMLTVHKAEEYIHAALDAGADGYLLKDDTYRELMVAMHSVLQGKIYLSPSICDKVVSGFLGNANKEKRAHSWDLLTHREREVVKLVAEGYRNKEIAEYLSLSPKTVEKHRSSVFKKLGLHNATQVASYAIENGLIGG